jgi:hypothetical protein
MRQCGSLAIFFSTDEQQKQLNQLLNLQSGGYK